MTEVQSQSTVLPDNIIRAQEADRDALVVRLDDLLGKYLHTLDEYQKVREQLSKQLSSGYLSLAQANFQNRSTTHYGQDNYDDRMQAIRKVTFDEVHAQIRFSIAREKKDEVDARQNDGEEWKDEQSDAKSKENSFKDAKESKKTAGLVDPLRWFGVLVPPALRFAQSNFITAVEDTVPQLANVARVLRNQEIEIGRVRKQIKRL